MRNLSPQQLANQLEENVSEAVRTADGLIRQGSASLDGALSDMSGSLSQAASDLRDELPQFAEQAQAQFLEVQEALQGTSLASNNIDILNDIKEQVGDAVAAAGSALTGDITKGIQGVFDELAGNLNLGQMFPGFDLGSARREDLGAIASEMTKQKNPLNGYTHFNYIFTMGCLSNDELNRPDATYRSVGARNVILRTTGGAGKSKTTTGFETGGAKTEFFMDDLQIHSLIGANPRTRSTNATHIEFTVMEPYSMGTFLQALQIASYEAGHRNYIEAPFYIMIEFTGWDHTGKSVRLPEMTRIIPFTWSFGEFNVQAGGSTYKVIGTPYHNNAFRDSVQALPTDVTITGQTFNEIVQTGVQSLASVLNTHLLKGVTGRDSPQVDDYIFITPKDPSSARMQFTSSDTSNGATFTVASSAGYDEVGTGAQPSFVRRQVDTEAAKESLLTGQFVESETAFYQYLQNQRGFTFLRSNISEDIKRFNENDLNVNDIGNSPLAITDALAGGNLPWGQNLLNYDSETGLYSRDGLTLDPTKRTITFRAGTPIQRILEELVLLTEYGENSNTNKNKPDENGMIQWFRIDAMVYNISNERHEMQFGRPPRVYVYRVLPYMVHESVFSSPSRGHRSYNKLREQAARKYNYIYTGENIDVLDFQINFNNQFFNNLEPDFGTNSRTQQSEGTTNEAGASDNITQSVSNPDNTFGSMTQTRPDGSRSLPNLVGGAMTENDKLILARTFQDNLINSDVDLVDMDIKILGDPYYLMDSGMGNYHARSTPYMNMTEDLTMDYESGQVDILFNFRTPIDYDPGDGLMTFASDFSDVKDFSGLYQVNEVTSNFSRGAFTQDLKLLRRPRQTLTPSTNISMFADNDAIEAEFLELQDAYNTGVQEGTITEDMNYWIVERLNNQAARFGGTNAVRNWLQSNGYNEMYTIWEEESNRITNNTRATDLAVQTSGTYDEAGITGATGGPEPNGPGNNNGSGTDPQGELGGTPVDPPGTTTPIIADPNRIDPNIAGGVS